LEKTLEKKSYTVREEGLSNHIFKIDIMLFNGGFWGMDFIWRFIWMGLIFWIFATPYRIPGQRYKRDTALDILRKRFATGELTMEDYNEKKRYWRLI